ncbi:hypothetical protein Dsin_025308 [Dipteronia sinensis]|uniref:RNase H type-1 domain-containing protein n=1 Tax=Dipteronia sinensis TaxID=43782 RepID=A0AAE0DWZ7_9ROSI|nr:hypothetical protein Dsin_025308 [Dipteronia sinensis]
MNQVADLVKVRTTWWFKFHAKGSKLLISTILLNIQESCVDSKPVKLSKREDWTLPDFSSLKFNVDGSSRGNPGDSGIGGVLRDGSGKVHGLFFEFVGVSDSIIAELLAIHKTISLCSSSPFFHDKEVIFISDSKATVSWINAEGIGSLTHVHLIYDICNVLNNLWNARVIFNSRSSNSFADSLAKMGSGKEGDRLIWDLC